MSHEPVEFVPLDVLDCPLRGVNLIEASAGTGKTWTIASLYCRLLLEETDGCAPPLVDAILVVTYTRAATAELRDRLRRRLEELLLVFQGHPGTDPFLNALADRFAEPEARERAVMRLTHALRGFDAAAIYTIHGFCQRVLTDAAFESGQPFHCESLEDDSDELLAIVEDYWRERVVTDPVLAGVVAERGETPELWLNDIRPWLARPYLHKPHVAENDLAPLAESVASSWNELVGDAGCVGDGFALLARTEGFKANILGAAQIERYRRQLCAMVDTGVRPVVDEAVLRFSRLAPDGLAAAMKKGFTAPEHPLFGKIGAWMAACLAYRDAVQLRLTALRLALIDWVDAALLERRREERSRSFDDLLTGLSRALDDPEAGEALARRVGDTFRVALIDEFQDTDPVQYGIFRKCFIAPRRGPVFLVGDPKQAIYSFRGADIFAYLNAREDVTAPPYSLDTNRRSLSPLVDAVNDLFARPQPFLLDRIHYQRVKADPSGGVRLAVEDDRPAFVAQWLGVPENGKPMSKEEASRRAAESCANEIARLLGLAAQGRARLEGETSRALGGGDIAVLVATHRQGERIREALRERGVHSVALTQESVFSTAEATEMLALLRAWAEPASDRLLRVALVTRLMGLDAGELLAQVDDETAWDTRLRLNQEDHQRWLEKGFMTAWHAFLAREKTAERLLPTPGGERSLTNFSHLAELLQKESGTRRGLVPLMTWFESRVAEPPGGEEAILRLESDASLVKIVTIHTSKGLQYPVVFCPFLWDGALERRDTAFWRFQEEGGTWLMPDTLADDTQRLMARSEMLAEKLRLLYVALTRAQFRQYVGWGWVQKMQTAALTWLWHGKDAASLADLEALKPDPGAMLADLDAFIAARPLERRRIDAGEGRIDGPSLARETGTFAARALARDLRTPWWVASFTSLTHAAHGAVATHVAERPDHDRGEWASDEALAPDRFGFPRGARPGTCLHAIFESIDFTWPDEPLRDATHEVLARFGIGDMWRDAAFDMVKRTLEVPLDDGVTLSRVQNARRLVEMEFLLPVGRLDIRMLRGVLTDPAMGLAPPLRAAAATLETPTVRGFLKGFMDLVFELDGRIYLVDYKSNHLGYEEADYGEAGLAESIAREHYYLQYLIYCVALKRYFAARGIVFAERFGGVRYLYLRGLNPEGNGVWRDRPSSRLLDALDSLFTVS
ncbi:exodeoxyribonuclease V subunit beta [Paludibacterium paludis]|uniref:RecBCD enzyme subunit RecB n=1 Tax=Paludibacterium paludis TaxID=1225769 RepID=A0A918P6F8_9NEIS|nr:exodeoxyribonuclease V subunit beta [Paludibacterium paludis]GGY27780.1 RecBCD enzyme subunit RecB [Paludibacterium paludis]